MKLDLGAGYKYRDGFTRVDADANSKPDILINLDDKELVLPFEDSSVEEVMCSHILEHIGVGFFRLMQEIYRVCENGAIVTVEVPHPRHEIFLNDFTHVRPIMVEGMRLFSKKYNQLEIERKGASSTLGLMYNVDFELVDFNFIHDPFYQNIVPSMTEEMAYRLFREALNTTLEIHMKLMVIK